MGTKNTNKFGSDTKFVGLTVNHKTRPAAYGVVIDGPKLIDGQPAGNDESYVVKVRWDEPYASDGEGWINYTSLTVHSGRGSQIGQYGRRN